MSGPSIGILIGCVCMVVGGFLLRAPDAAWSVHAYFLQARGLRPERNPIWESSRRIEGLLFSALGLILVVAGIVAVL